MLPISVKYPIKRNQDGFFGKTYTTLDTYRANINLLLRTNEGELPFDYDFGLPLVTSLFEPETEELVDYLDRTIRRKIAKYIPGININSLLIEMNSDYNKINIKLKISSSEDPLNIEEINIGL